MRTTVNLDPEIAQAAKVLARARSQSLGAVISDLVRRGLAQEAAQAPHAATGFPVFVVGATAAPLTIDAIKRDEDEG